MADKKDVSSDIHLLKRTRISVYVDEALPDILVVTFEFGVKIFKGVLLDSTKKNMPCGVPNLNPAFNTTSASKPNANDDDSLYSVNQRYAYTDPSNAAAAAKKKNVHISSKYKNNKMTVRLRPRQVLCSKCKGICNENSENVTRKRKTSETLHPAASPLKRTPSVGGGGGNGGPVTRSSASELAKKKLPLKRTLMPKAPVELPPLSGNVNKLNIDNNKRPLVIVSNLNLTNNNCDSKAIAAAVAAAADEDIAHSIEHSEAPHKTTDAKLKRILRKKRSVGSTEDLWEDTVLEEAGKKNNNNPENPQNGAPAPEQQQPLGGACTNTTRTIKICYGPQGEGTVLKIPAQIENLNVADDDLEENVDEDSQKAARKAMKKARKEAKRKTVVTSPERTSPRYAVGASSPRYTVGSASPRHGLGNHSPRYITTAAALEPNTPKKRKHKLKHKKKHREDKDRKHEKEKEGGKVQSELAPKEQCLTQKLSINLKRLSASYTAAQLTGATDETSSDENSEQLPDFPPSNPPLMLRINAQTLNSATGADGERLNVGDVVWGKIHGFPWWPGKVLTISNTDSQGPQAHVSWYGSATSSLIQCDQLSPYLDNFKTRYNKKKRGPYKDAIRQATTEARLHAEQKVSGGVGSPTRNIMPVVPPALASPREINVIS